MTRVVYEHDKVYPRIADGVKRPPSKFVNHKIIPVWHMAPPFRDFSWVWSGYKMKQPGRKSVHQKLSGGTSNTCGIFLNWRNFVVALINITNQIQKKHCCNCTHKGNFSTITSFKKCSQMIATDNNRRPEIAIWLPKPEVLT